MKKNSGQVPLFLHSEFEIETAQQLAWSCGRDNPSESDLALAVKLSTKWNKQRIKLKQRPFQ